jgi:hypothetical protein
MIMLIARVVMGILLPEDILSTPAFQFIAAFVALNTIMYVALAIAKVLPKIYVSDLVSRHGRRRETRSIHPDAPIDG